MRLLVEVQAHAGMQVIFSGKEMNVDRRTLVAFLVVILALFVNHSVSQGQTGSGLFNGSGIPGMNQAPVEVPGYQNQPSGLSKWLDKQAAKQITEPETRSPWPKLGLFKKKTPSLDPNNLSMDAPALMENMPRLFQPRDPNRPTFWQDLSARSKNLFSPPQLNGPGFLGGLKQGSENLKNRFGSWDKLTSGIKNPFQRNPLNMEKSGSPFNLFNQTAQGTTQGLRESFQNGMNNAGSAMQSAGNRIQGAGQNIQNTFQQPMNQPPMRSAQGTDLPGQIRR